MAPVVVAEVVPVDGHPRHQSADADHQRGCQLQGGDVRQLVEPRLAQPLRDAERAHQLRGGERRLLPHGGELLYPQIPLAQGAEGLLLHRPVLYRVIRKPGDDESIPPRNVAGVPQLIQILVAELRVLVAVCTPTNDGELPPPRVPPITRIGAAEHQLHRQRRQHHLTLRDAADQCPGEEEHQDGGELLSHHDQTRDAERQRRHRHQLM